ncbi:DUF1294 domain-containing protein [Clostridiaceae bacterium 35-E11]
MIRDNIFKIKEFYLLLYIVIINLYGISITAIDKYKAKKEKWRIRERTFFVTAFLGGAAGVIMGMTMFRHKTQHKSFYIGIPILYLCNIASVFFFIYWIYIRP